MKSVRTPRLELQPVDERNARDLWEILQQPDLREYQDIPRVAYEEFERQVRARPRSLRRRPIGRFEWLIRVAPSGVPVGWVSLRIHDRSPGIAEIGYSLLLTERGKGYASEAVRGVIDETFRESEIEEIHAASVPTNDRSRAVLNRTGFRETRTLRNGAVVRGRRVDVVQYEMTRAEWQRASHETRS